VADEWQRSNAVVAQNTPVLHNAHAFGLPLCFINLISATCQFNPGGIELDIAWLAWIETFVRKAFDLKRVDDTSLLQLVSKVYASCVQSMMRAYFCY
jgi:hypothetical protein